MEPIKFHTERLIIRQFCERDIKAYFRLVSHPKVHCFAGEALKDIEEAKAEVQRKMNKNDGSELSVCLKETDEFIGTLFGCWENDTFSVCWNFLPDYGRKGYAYEAARAYLDFLFNHKNARRVYAYVEDYNITSQNLCKKLGMRQEGIFKEYMSFIKNKDGSPIYENTIQFAILKKEWKQSSII